MHTIGLGALQQRHMAQPRRRALERAQKVAQHQLVGADLFLFLPARDQPRPFVERGINEMGDAGERGCKLRAGGFIGEVERMPSRTENVVWTPAGQRDHLAVLLRAEVFQGGVADETGGAGDQNFLKRHSAIIARNRLCFARRAR